MLSEENIKGIYEKMGKYRVYNNGEEIITPIIESVDTNFVPEPHWKVVQYDENPLVCFSYVMNAIIQLPTEEFSKIFQ